MRRLKALSVPIFLVLLVCGVWHPGPVRAQTSTVTINPAPTACLNSIVKYYVPNMTTPMTIAIFKRLSVTMQVCNTTMMNSAFCNPGVAAATNTLAASVFTMFGQIGMNPSCAWNCTGACGNTISTTGSQDGLPVELLDFKVTVVPQTLNPPKALSKHKSPVSPHS